MQGKFHKCLFLFLALYIQEILTHGTEGSDTIPPVHPRSRYSSGDSYVHSGATRTTFERPRSVSLTSSPRIISTDDEPVEPDTIPRRRRSESLSRHIYTYSKDADGSVRQRIAERKQASDEQKEAFRKLIPVAPAKIKLAKIPDKGKCVDVSLQEHERSGDVDW